jgi:hypothetical protein
MKVAAILKLRRDESFTARICYNLARSANHRFQIGVEFAIALKVISALKIQGFGHEEINVALGHLCNVLFVDRSCRELAKLAWFAG